MSRRIVFAASAFVDFNDWSEREQKIQRKIVKLIQDIDRL